MEIHYFIIEILNIYSFQEMITNRVENFHDEFWLKFYKSKIAYLHFHVNAFKYVCSEKCVILSEI